MSVPANLKECNDCKRFLRLDKFRSRIQHGKPYIIAKCRECEVEYNKKWHDPEKRRIAERKRFANPKRRDRKNKYQRKWRENNIEKNRSYHRKSIKKNVDGLTDSYIKRMFRVAYVPPQLIKVKRLHLICKRTLKTIKE